MENFWRPYHKALYENDFRDLIKALRAGDPRTNEPEVRELIAQQLENPATPKRPSRYQAGARYGEAVLRLVREKGISEYAARKIVLNQHPGLNEETLKTYVRCCKEVEKAHLAALAKWRISEGNQ